MSDIIDTIADNFLSNGQHFTVDNELQQTLIQFVDQPEKLHRILFKVVSKKQIKKMLPPTLKKMKTSTVKRLCLEKLQQLPRKSIVNLIVEDGSPVEGVQSEQKEPSGQGKVKIERIEHSIRSKKGNTTPHEMAKSTSPDESKVYCAAASSPNHMSTLETNKSSSSSSSWTRGSGEGQWSRTSSISKARSKSPQPESSSASNINAAAASCESNTSLNEMEAEELELRARALRSLSDRLNRLGKCSLRQNSLH